MARFDLGDTVTALLCCLATCVFICVVFQVASCGYPCSRHYTVAFLAPDGHPVKTFVAVSVSRLSSGGVYATDVTGRTLSWTGGTIVEPITTAEKAP